MKKIKIMRWLGILLVLALIIIPAGPALAVNDITVNPTSGQIGDTITVTGTNFSPSTAATERYATVLFGYNNITTTTWKASLTSYKELGGATIGYEGDPDAGKFTTTFQVPSVLNSGTVSHTVTSGTYYIYIVIYRFIASSGDTILDDYVYAKSAFTVVGGNITINPTTGKVGSTVTISGTSFTPNAAIAVTFGGKAVALSGSTVTSASGTFTASFIVPDSVKGAQTVSVTVGSTNKTATFTVQPDIIINPQSGPAGSTIQVIGTGFGRRTNVSIFFNNALVTLTLPTTSTSVLTDTDGSFEATFVVPSSVTAAGSYTIEADDGSDPIATANFTLTTSSPTTPTPTPDSGSIDVTATGKDIGSTVMVAGTGFTPGSEVTISFGNKVVATGEASAGGSFIVQFVVPAVASGDYVITATDGTVTATYTFTVVATPPATPTPSEPAAGTTIQFPATFTWNAASGQGVTYDFQIATDPNFASGSIILNLTQLTSNSYQLTEAQELLLAGQAEPYYWRVRAVDAGGNAGAWTAPADFYVAKPFSFPTWAIATLGVIGAVIFFGIGYLVGRRTAFYY